MLACVGADCKLSMLFKAMLLLLLLLFFQLPPQPEPARTLASVWPAVSVDLEVCVPPRAPWHVTCLLCFFHMMFPFSIPWQVTSVCVAKGNAGAEGAVVMLGTVAGGVLVLSPSSGAVIASVSASRIPYSNWFHKKPAIFDVLSTLATAERVGDTPTAAPGDAEVAGPASSLPSDAEDVVPTITVAGSKAATPAAGDSRSGASSTGRISTFLLQPPRSLKESTASCSTACEPTSVHAVAFQDGSVCWCSPVCELVASGPAAIRASSPDGQPQRISVGFPVFAAKVLSGSEESSAAGAPTSVAVCGCYGQVCVLCPSSHSRVYLNLQAEVNGFGCGEFDIAPRSGCCLS